MRPALLCLDNYCRRRKAFAGCGEFDLAGFFRGLHDHLRQAVEQAA
jgi:hypothetical protein